MPDAFGYSVDEETALNTNRAILIQVPCSWIHPAIMIWVEVKNGSARFWMKALDDS